MKKEAIEHYEKMIKWAMSMDKNEGKNDYKMKLEIGEFWQGYYCPYCRKYLKSILVKSTSCTECPLTKDNSSTAFCCGGLWNKMNKSRTWGGWIKNAKKVLKYIKRRG